MAAMVDFPLPLAPTSAIAAPGSMVNETSSTASTSRARSRPWVLKRFETPSTRSGCTDWLGSGDIGHPPSFGVLPSPHVTGDRPAAQRFERRLDAPVVVLDDRAARGEGAALAGDRQVRRR